MKGGHECCASIGWLCPDHIVLLREEKAFIKTTNPISTLNHSSAHHTFVSLPVFVSTSQLLREETSLTWGCGYWVVCCFLLISMKIQACFACAEVLLWCMKGKEGLRRRIGKPGGSESSVSTLPSQHRNCYAFGLTAPVLASSQSCSFLHLLLCSSVVV